MTRDALNAVDALADRLTEMELRYMEQQATIDALDAIVREQDAEIARLAKELERLQQAISSSGDGDGDAWPE